jgi:hypothetical protein
LVTDNGANIIKAGRLLQGDVDTNLASSASPADDSDTSDDEDQDDQRSSLGALPPNDDEPDEEDEEEQYLNRDKEIEKEMNTLGKKRGRCFRYVFVSLLKCLN